MAGTLTGDAKLWRETADCADWLQIKGVLAHAGRGKGSLEVWRLGWHAHCDAKLWEGTADSADWSRLGAGCRRQDCQWIHHKGHKESQRAQREERKRGRGKGRCPLDPGRGWAPPAPAWHVLRTCLNGTHQAAEAARFREDARGTGDPAGTIPAVHPPFTLAGRHARREGAFQISADVFLKPLRVWGETLRVLGRNP